MLCYNTHSSYHGESRFQSALVLLNITNKQTKGFRG